MKSINPANNRGIQEYQTHSEEEIQAIVAATEQEWKRWRNTSFEYRSMLMKKISSLLLQKQGELASLITREMGKCIAEAEREIEKCAGICHFFADHAESMLADEKVETEASKSYVAFQPLGILLGIMPWNFPFWQVFRFFAPAIMAGNGALLKHAWNVPGCAVAIEEVVREAGFPEHLFRNLLISSNEGVATLIKDDRIKAITLTGGELAGSRVAEQAGKEIKKLVLELGGNDALIVLEDADLQACVEAGVRSRMVNAGQACIAAKRFVVVESVYEEFLRLKKACMESLVVGDPINRRTNIGPIARRDLLEKVEEQVDESLQLGAKAILGGKRLDREGNYYPPTLLVNVKKGMPAYDQEIFGPVSSVIVVKDEAEAIHVANDSIYGLAGSIWTRDLARGERVAHQIEVGAIYVNELSKSNLKLPFGGIKKSGYGRELSHYGIKEFVNIKTVWIQ